MEATAENYRKGIISKIKELPTEKLPLVDTYLDSLTIKEKQKVSILSYTGIFKELDDETFNNLTVNLSKNRSAQTLDKRLAEDEKDYISAKESISKLKEKYGL
jgi:hypothetical protein